MESWYFIKDGPHAPAWNMACDEYLLDQASKYDQPVLRIYGWDRPAVTIGYFQSYPKDLPAHYIVTRRPTGGAMVFHDTDLTFTVVLPPNHAWLKLGICERYQKIHERIGKVFETSGAKPSLAGKCSSAQSRNLHQGTSLCFAKNSRYDVVVNGAKVAGGAQRLTKHGLLHQGSIQGEGVKVSTKEVRKAWESFGVKFEDLKLTSKDDTEIDRLVKEKYGTTIWNVERVK